MPFSLPPKRVRMLPAVGRCQVMPAALRVLPDTEGVAAGVDAVLAGGVGVGAGAGVVRGGVAGGGVCAVAGGV
jgi:hypothetical protein